MKLKLSAITIMFTVSLLAQSYSIKGPANPKPHEQTAMRELADYLAKRIDGKLTIGGKSPVTFQVGDTEFAKQHNLLSDTLPDEEWHIKSFGEQVILNGGGTRGVLYATYHFLEDYCDIHWWSAVEEYIPAASPLTLNALDAHGKPAFLYRDIFRSNRPDPPTSIRLRLNRCGDSPVPASYGGSFNYGPPNHSHTFDMYVPAEKYLKDHPNYFSLVKGKRVGGSQAGQLCLTNPALKQIFLESLTENIRKGDEDAAKAGVPAPRIYDVSMNDNWNKCECDDCSAECEKFNASGHYLKFVNWLAAEVSKTHHNVFISTLAYFYTEEPPKGGIRAADNVIVKLCDTRSNQCASILEADNRTFHDFIAEWKQFAKHLFIWDYAIVYTANTNGLPFASEFNYAELFRYYLANNVTGVFWEHQEPYNSDMFELKFFLETKLMEDPFQDNDALIRKFMACYYGAAAPYILEYRKAIDAARKANKGFVSWFPSETEFDYITNDVIVKCQDLFDKAEAAVACDKTLTARVRHARCGLDRLNASRASAYQFHDPAVKADNAPVMDAKLPVARQLDAWPAWCMQFPDGKTHADNARGVMGTYSTDSRPRPVPEPFKDRRFYAFFTNHFTLHDRGNIKPCKDDESPIGVATRVNVSASNYYVPPFAAGLYDSEKPLTMLNTVFTVEKTGYNYYYVGKAVIPKKGEIFVTRSWRIKLGLKGREFLQGKEFEIWVSAKFTGPKYIKDDKKEDYIYVDSILLVEP
ncbi:MAG: DUF4838 domain-containing protein [Victivallales bacterium]|nr:DUF4838 domain-containing protein [Victivallales bacterium]